MVPLTNLFALAQLACASVVVVDDAPAPLCLDALEDALTLCDDSGSNPSLCSRNSSTDSVESTAEPIWYHYLLEEAYNRYIATFSFLEKLQASILGRSFGPLKQYLSEPNPKDKRLLAARWGVENPWAKRTADMAGVKHYDEAEFDILCGTRTFEEIADDCKRLCEELRPCLEQCHNDPDLWSMAVDAGLAGALTPRASTGACAFWADGSFDYERSLLWKLEMCGEFLKDGCVLADEAVRFCAKVYREAGELKPSIYLVDEIRDRELVVKEHEELVRSGFGYMVETYRNEAKKLWMLNFMLRDLTTANGGAERRD
ncbi:hypothetical protein PAPHI01_2431 [Pancytospora philotis]|nr:hypothetical protein PAPHI01_2277 [Pancytospora philotis]KAI4293157.1 hypothetical protein PAPHI01_2431 [Pancytospora philotis]